MNNQLTFKAKLAGSAALIALVGACGGGSGGGNSGLIPPGTPSAADLAIGPGAAAGAGNSQSPPATGPAVTPSPAPGATAPPAPDPTLAERIAVLERSGAYPALDRSSDIKGPDANNNGVRDDIESWINLQPVNDAQRRALMQKARALLNTLSVDLKDKAALQRAGEGLMASTNCGGDNFSPYVTWSKLAGKIEAMTANTKERALRYMQYNAARSGSSTTLPDGNTCDP